MRTLPLLCVLVAALGCHSAWRAPSVPGTRDQELVAFPNEASLRTFLADIASTRPARRVMSIVISEHDGDWTSVHVDPRLTPRLTVTTAAAVTQARPMLESGGAVWIARSRAVTRITQAGGALEAAALAPLPGGTRSVEPDGLLALDGAVAVIVRNDCGAFTVARYRASEGPPALEGALRLCGTLAAEPWVARVGQDVLAYAVFDPIEEESRQMTLPTVQSSGGPARSLPSLGRVYYPVRRARDVLMRTLVRCDAALSECSARTWVSPRSHIDVLWADENRVGLAVADRAESAVYLIPRVAGPLRYANVSGWAFGLSGLGDGRLALLRSRELMRWPGVGGRPSVAVIDDRGRATDGVELPVPVTGRDTRWTWAVHAGRLVYGPSRSHNIGGAEAPRAFVAVLPDGPVDEQPIVPSVDAVLFAGDEAILVGANGQGVGIIARRPLAGPGRWRQHPQSPRRLYESALDQAERTMSIALGERRLLIVPYSHLHYMARYQLQVFELTAEGLISHGSFQRSTPPTDQVLSDDRVGAMAWDGRLLLRFPGEAVLVELDAEGARELARTPL